MSAVRLRCCPFWVTQGQACRALSHGPGLVHLHSAWHSHAKCLTEGISQSLLVEVPNKEDCSDYYRGDDEGGNDIVKADPESCQPRLSLVDKHSGTSNYVRAATHNVITVAIFDVGIRRKKTMFNLRNVFSQDVSMHLEQQIGTLRTDLTTGESSTVLGQPGSVQTIMGAERTDARRETGRELEVRLHPRQYEQPLVEAERY